MSTSTHPEPIAWVPSKIWALDANRQRGPVPYIEAQKIAIDWIQKQSSVTPCVLYCAERTLDPNGHLDEVDKLALSTGKVVKPKGMHNFTGNAPVIVHDNALTPQGLVDALHIAKGHPLVVMECSQINVQGWAFGTNALDLSPTLNPTPFSIGASEIGVISSELFIAGANAWSGSADKTRARKALKPLNIPKSDLAAYILSQKNDVRAYKGIMNITGL